MAGQLTLVRTLEEPMARKKPGAQGVAVYLDEKLYLALKHYAVSQRKSLSEILAAWIGEKWAEHPERARFEKIAREAAKAAPQDDEGQHAAAA
jgi:hypothetical protein